MIEVSVIVRFHNEEEFLGPVMDALVRQDFPKDAYEIVAVDNRSTDRSREIALGHTSRLVEIGDYQPGKALNRAIEHAKGKHIAVLSAHTLPADRRWLRTLYSHMGESRLAGVYGAQLYQLHSKFLDKRDLDIFSTLTPRVETEDSDFWNANSMFPREVWREQRFEETVFELEDHFWTKLLLPRGYRIHFEPRALVYHYSHVERLDREYLPESSLSEKQRIDEAVKDLQSNGEDWPTAMRAGLTLSSLTRSAHIETATEAMGRTMNRHWDFDVRWRMAQGLGKIRNPASVHYLIANLDDRSFYPRDEAAWSLGRLGELSVEPLLRRLSGFGVRAIPFAALALGLSGVASAEETAVGVFLDELGSGNLDRMLAAAYFCGEIAGRRGSGRLVGPLVETLRLEQPELLRAGCWALGCFAEAGSPGVDWAMLRSLSSGHPDPLIRFEATVAMGKRARRPDGQGAVEWLFDRLSDPDGRVRYGAVQSLRLLAQEGRGIDAGRLKPYRSDSDFGVGYELGLVAGSSPA